MGAPDAVKDHVYAFPCETVNFFDEVELSIVNWDTAQVRHGYGSSR
jgi:hypothetical protein